MEVEFTSMEVKYIPEEEEHMLLMKVFEVSVVDSMENDPRVTYLERFKSARMLSRELMKEVIQDRLSLFLLNDEAPLDYLFYSYYRAHEAARSVAYIKDLNVKTVMTSLVSLAKKLAVDFFRIEILKFRITKSSAWLLRLLMSELACEEFLLLGFLDQLFESDYDSIQYILKEVYDDLRVRVLKGDSTMSLSALELLVKCPVAAKALVSHPCWIPRNGTGRDLELYSVLGCFFRVSALPDDPLFQAEHNIRIYEHTRRDLNHWYEGLAKVVSCLLENPITRENTLDFLAEVINKNSVMEFRASSGMLVNLIAVMLRLCQPLIDDVLSAQTIIDPKYVLYENRLRLSELTPLHPTSDGDGENCVIQSQEATNSSSSANESVNKTYLSECFFMTARVLRLGLSKAMSEFNLVSEQQEDAVTSKKAMQEQTLTPQLLQEISQLEKKIQLHEKEILCYEAQLLDAALYKHALSYYRLMVVWLVGLVGRAPLPLICPKEFDRVPVHFVEDTMDFLILSSPILPQHMAVMLDDFWNFIIMFMASPEYISNPHLRFKMVGVLYDWISAEGGGEVAKRFFQKNQLSLEYLEKNLLKVFVDKELSTEWPDQPLERYITRLNIAKFLRCLWSDSRLCLKIHEKTTEEKGVYLGFMNSFIDDTTSLLDQILGSILELKEREAQTPTADVAMRRGIPDVMKLSNEYVTTLSFISRKIVVPFFLPEMVDKVADALKYILLQLVDPPHKFADLRDPKQLAFLPDKLLQLVATMYLDLYKGDGSNILPEAINRAGVDWEQFFGAASDLRRIIGEHAPGDLQVFGELGNKVDTVIKEDAAALKDIPDEYLDPVVGTIMKDPLILPSYKVMDRSVLKRLILSGVTKDPYSRADLIIDELVSDTKLKAKIDAWMKDKWLRNRRRLKRNLFAIR